MWGWTKYFYYKYIYPCAENCNHLLGASQSYEPLDAEDVYNRCVVSLSNHKSLCQTSYWLVVVFTYWRASLRTRAFDAEDVYNRCVWTWTIGVGIESPNLKCHIQLVLWVRVVYKSCIRTLWGCWWSWELLESCERWPKPIQMWAKIYFRFGLWPKPIEMRYKTSCVTKYFECDVNAVWRKHEIFLQKFFVFCIFQSEKNTPRHSDAVVKTREEKMIFVLLKFCLAGVRVLT